MKNNILLKLVSGDIFPYQKEEIDGRMTLLLVVHESE